jgi:hypothetical protein
VLKAFCNVFEDCSLWAGSGYNWIMLGIKNAQTPVNVDAFTRQWRDPRVAGEMKRLGFDAPEQFASLFIADKKAIERWTQGVRALTDNFPKMLEEPYDESKSLSDKEEYKALLDPGRAWADFSTSPTIAKIWPAELMEASRGYFPFAYRTIRDNPVSSLDFIKTLHGYLIEPRISGHDINTLLGSNVRAQEIIMGMLRDNGLSPSDLASLADLEIAKAHANGQSDLVLEWLQACKHAAVHALKRGEWQQARQYYNLIATYSDPQNARDFIFLSGYLSAREGRWEEVDEMSPADDQASVIEAYDEFKFWLRSTFRPF